MSKYPQNLKEALIASVPNAMVMVMGMVALNLWIYGALTWGHFVRVVPIMFIAAFSLDFFVVGPLVMKLVKRYDIPAAMPFVRVALMAGILTFCAPIIESGTVISAGQYITAAPRNYIAALLLQIVIAMRIGLFVLERYRRMFIHK